MIGAMLLCAGVALAILATWRVFAGMTEPDGGCPWRRR